MMKNTHMVKLIITPDMAKAMLARSRSNRQLRSRLLHRLCTDIRAGDWRVTGETLIFDDEGYLIDGQHRLWACVETGISIESYVVMGGISSDAMLYTDIGTARTPGDALTIMGYKHGNSIAAMCRWIHRYNTGAMAYRASTLSRSELIEMMNKYSDLHDSVVVGRRTIKFMTVSLASALHWLMARFDRPLANDFFTGIGYGVDNRSSPTSVLREKLISVRHSKKLARYPEHVLAAWTIKAWNLLREGKTAKIITWYPDSPTKPESFPIIK